MVRPAVLIIMLIIMLLDHAAQVGRPMGCLSLHRLALGHHG